MWSSRALTLDTSPKCGPAQPTVCSCASTSREPGNQRSS
jgi:hypothetical protein